MIQCHSCLQIHPQGNREERTQESNKTKYFKLRRLTQSDCSLNDLSALCMFLKWVWARKMKIERESVCVELRENIFPIWVSRIWPISIIKSCFWSDSRVGLDPREGVASDVMTTVLWFLNLYGRHNTIMTIVLTFTDIVKVFIIWAQQPHFRTRLLSRWGDLYGHTDNCSFIEEEGAVPWKLSR